jgi:predicted nuclease of predicted toxin-antitoxin system
VADENIDEAIVQALRAAGHEVWSVADHASGSTDADVLREAVARGATLITADKDFGELVFRLRQTNHGVLLVRLPGWPTAERAAQVVAVVAAWGAGMARHFTVIDATGVRSRPS